MTESDPKNLKAWHEHQTELEFQQPPKRGYREGHVWRCTVGLNVGHEIDGKSRRFWRPVLVVRNFNNETFLGAPLTKSASGRPFHVPITIMTKRGKSYVVVSQLRSMDARRLQQKISTISLEDFQRVQRAIVDMILGADS